MNPFLIVLFVILGLAALFCLWLFFIGTAGGKKMGDAAYKKYAHRGLHGALGGEEFCAENSKTAFERACQRGFGIELDVRLSKDGVPVVFHDGDLLRVCGVDKKVCELTAAELSEIKLMNTADTVPTFREVLELVGGRVPLVVELKEEGLDHSTAKEALAILAEYSGEYVIEAFSPFALGYVRRHAPSAVRGFLTDKLTANEKYNTAAYRLIQRFWFNFIARPHFIAQNHERPRHFPSPLVRAIFKPAFVAWTVRSAEEEAVAYKNGFTAIIFENYIPEGKE